MKIDIINIIKEEAQALHEGFSSYEEKQDWETQYQDHLKARSTDNANGELVNRMPDANGEVINIYRNPLSLRNFGASVRAISTDTGDLFVGQFDKDYLHADMAEQIGIAANRYVPWHRLLETNKFNSVDAGRISDLNQYFDAVKKNHQQFEFHTVDLQQQGY
jgi:hypothetical protein